MAVPKKLIILFAGAIFLLHGLVPHKHEVGLHSDTALAKEMSTSISSLIEFIFHEDLDQGTLEHVVVYQPDHLLLSLPITIPKAAIIFIRSSISINKNKATQSEINYQDPLRGPPLLS